MRFSAACGAVVFLAACAPNPAAPVRVMAIVPSVSNTYETHEVELTTIENITGLGGSVVTMVGGAQVVINGADPTQASATSEVQYADALLKNKGNFPRANYIEKGGVLWPADFHSWAMVTTYFNFEQAFKYFQRIYDGKPTTELDKAKVLYWSTFQNIDSGSEAGIVNNAFYFSPVQAFLLVPFDATPEFQKVPFALNMGVIGHEYSHLVFNKRAYGGAFLPKPLTSWRLGPFNLIKSMDEGFADFHGYGATCLATGPGCQPAFLAASIDNKDAVAARSLADANHCMSKPLRDSLAFFEGDKFTTAGNHYLVGTLIATALYQAGNNPAGKDYLVILQKALIASYDDNSPTKLGFKQLFVQYQDDPHCFTPELMTDTIASHISDMGLRRLVCGQLTNRLQLNFAGADPSCPAMTACGTFTPVTTCPTL